MSSQDICRVTVRAGSRQMDLSLPAAAPIAELTPVIAELSGDSLDVASGVSEGTPPAWTLARVGSVPFEITATLADVGVLDGEELHLVDAAVWQAPEVEDVNEAVARAIEGNGPRWSGDTRRWAIGGLAVASALAGAGVAVWRSALSPAGAAACLAVGAAAVGLSVVGRRDAGRRPATVTLALIGWAGAAMGGWGLGGGGWPSFALAGAGLVAAILASSPVLPAVAPGAALFATVAAATLTVTVAGEPLPAAVSVVAVIAVLATRLPPLFMGGRLMRLIEDVSQCDLVVAARRARTIHASLSAGMSAVAAMAGLVLLGSGNEFGAGLAAILAVGLLLRARTYRYLAEGLPPALAAGLLLGGLLLVVTWQVLGETWAAAGLLAAGPVLAGLAALPRWPAASERLVRLVWLALDLVLLPLALGAMGAFHTLATLAAGVHLR